MSLKKPQIVIVLGSGGVGKTTISSAVGILATKTKKNVLCISVDPSKRLSDRLNFDPEINSLQKINIDSFNPSVNKGNIFVSVLKPKILLNELILPYMSKAKKKLQDNHLLPYLLSLPGLNEYMSYELIYRTLELKDFDFIVIDTPPLNNALDFFSAPEKIHKGLEEPLLWSIIKSYELYGRVIPDYIKDESNILWKYILKLTGQELISELMDIVVAFIGAVVDIKRHIRYVTEKILDSNPHYLIVSTPHKSRVEDGLLLYEQLKNKGEISFIFNRCNEYVELQNEKNLYNNISIFKNNCDKLYLSSLIDKLMIIIDEFSFEIKNQQLLISMLKNCKKDIYFLPEITDDNLMEIINNIEKWRILD